MDVGRAFDLAAGLLADRLPQRWAHSQGVARRAELLAPVLGPHTDPLRAAALLHDIGYAPELIRTGFHPLDGARYLRGIGADRLTAQLVAHHSHALYQARAGGLDRQLLVEFGLPPATLAAALTWCDMTTGPDGRPMTLAERLVDVEARHGHDPAWLRTHTARTPALHAAVAHIDACLAQQPAPVG